MTKSGITDIRKAVDLHKCKVCRRWKDDGCHYGGGTYGTPGKGRGRHDHCFMAADWAKEAILLDDERTRNPICQHQE